MAEQNGVVPSLARPQVPTPLAPIGRPGLNQYGGYIREDLLPELTGLAGVRVYKKMRDNSPIVGAILYAVEMLMRPVTWTCTPVDDTLEAARAAAFAHHALFEDCLTSWTTRLSDILSMLPFGWAFCEWTLKRRRGPTRDPWTTSQATDGLLGFADLSLRAQDTLLQWEFDERDQVLAMRQQPPTGPVVTIPRAKALLFRPTVYKSNPEGRSILRNAYRPWYFVEHIENIEAIGIERDLAGLPIVKVPLEVMQGMADGADPMLRQLFDSYKALATRIKRNEQEGVVFPQVYDQDGHELYKLELLTSGGRRQFDTDTVIKRYELRIAQSVLADMILIGHEAVGSYALASSKTNLLATTLGGYLDVIGEVLTQDALRVLWAVNALNPALLPTLEHGDVEHVDIKEFSEGVKNLAQAGFDVTDLENPVRLKMGLPPTEDQEAS